LSPAVHCVLYSVREHENEHEIKRSQLPDLPLAHEAKHDEQEPIDDRGSDDDLFEHETARIPHGSLGLVAATHIAVPNLNGSYQSDDPGVTQGARNAIKGTDAFPKESPLSG
jgi:hypothetical protein